MAPEELRQFLIRGFDQAADILHHKLHPGAKMPPDRRVVLVQTHGDGFPYKNLLTHMIGGQCGQLVFRGRALPSCGELRGQALHAPTCDDDRVVRACRWDGLGSVLGRRAATGKLVQAKDQTTADEKLAHRLAQYLPHQQHLSSFAPVTGAIAPVNTRSARYRPARSRSFACRAKGPRQIVWHHRRSSAASGSR